MEKELEGIFTQTPSYAAATAIDKWKKLGAFPIATQIEHDKVILDFRFPIECETDAAAKRKYCGQVNFFENKHSHGMGRTEYQNGSIYEGENQRGLKNGFGRHIWPNGDYYVGEFKNGVMNGEGLYVAGKDGARTKGLFRNGIFVK